MKTKKKETKKNRTNLKKEKKGEKGSKIFSNTFHESRDPRSVHTLDKKVSERIRCDGIGEGGGDRVKM